MSRAGRLLLFQTLCLIVLSGPVYAQSYTLLFTFTATDGLWPDENAKLTLDAAGDLYGAALDGGNNPSGCGGSGCGTVFELRHTGEFSVLHNFDGTDGSSPAASLLKKGSTIYGVAAGGGNNGDCQSSGGCGTIFKLDAKGNFAVLYNFTGGSDGSNPGWGGIVRDSLGNLYGAARSGGNNPICPNQYYIPGCGTIFKLDTNGQLATLYTFSGAADGSWPLGDLIRDSQGNIYGVTQSAAGGSQTAYKLDATGNFTDLHTFSGESDGGNPNQLSRIGNYVYGTTQSGGDPNCYYGSPGCGIIYKLNTKTGEQIILHTFQGTSDGAYPGELTVGGSGSLYGSAGGGGEFGCGTVFTIDSAGTFNTLYSFTCEQSLTFFDLNLALDKAGNLYGTTAPWPSGLGTIFEITP